MACMEEACCPFLSLSNGEAKPSLCRSPLTRALVTARRKTANTPPKSLRWRLQRTRNNGRLPSASYYWSCDAAPALVCFLIQEPGLSGVKHG